MEPCELKVTQFSILWNIKESGPLSVTDLAKIMRLDRTTLVRTLKSLEDNKYIESSAGNDPRKRLVMVTDKGSEMLITAIPYWEKAQTQIKSLLGCEKLSGLNSLLLEIELLSG
jgi:DNA-binding MarR family transcriptional regulator